MNREIIKQAEFMGLLPKGMLDRIDKGRCPLCNKPIDPGEFKDQLSVKEFGISGMCQHCQDEVFGENDD